MVGVFVGMEHVFGQIISPVEASPAINSPIVSIRDFAKASDFLGSRLNQAGLPSVKRKSRFASERNPLPASDGRDSRFGYWPGVRLDSRWLVKMSIHIPQSHLCGGETRSSIGASRIDYGEIDSEGPTYRNGINLKLANNQFGPMSRNKFSAGKSELIATNSTKTDGSGGQDSGNNRQPPSVASDCLLCRFLIGIIIGVAGVFGGGALLWRMWGV